MNKYRYWMEPSLGVFVVNIDWSVSIDSWSSLLSLNVCLNSQKCIHNDRMTFIVENLDKKCLSEPWYD